MRSSKSLAGLKAQRYGAAFEHVFESHCKRRGLVVTRMPDGCKQVGPKRVIRVKTPWDWILTANGTSAFLDTKTVDAETFPPSKMELHQLLPMSDHQMHGALGGYVIWFRPVDRVVFVDSMTLLRFKKQHRSVRATPDPDTADLGSVHGPGGMCLTRLFKPAAPKQEPLQGDCTT